MLLFIQKDALKRLKAAIQTLLEWHWLTLTSQVDALHRETRHILQQNKAAETLEYTQPANGVRCLPGSDTAEHPNGQDDEQGSHARASVAGPQRPGDDVIALERDGQDGQHRGVGHRQLNKRHQPTCRMKRKHYKYLILNSILTFPGNILKTNVIKRYTS